jgi:hypothetical protein
MAKKIKRAGNKTTEVVVLLDRSGSMQQGRSDHEGGLRAFVEDQRKLPGEVLFTFVQFDSDNPLEVVYDGAPLGDVSEDKLRLNPRGTTPLLEATGKTIAHVRERHGKGEAPKLTVMAIVTDGQENASGPDWTKGRVKDAIAECEKDGWKVLYLGANVDAFSEAGGMGLASSAALNYVPSPAAIKATYAAMSQNLCCARGAVMMGADAKDASVSMNWKDRQRKTAAK